MEVKYDEQTKQVAIYKPSYAQPRCVIHISVETQTASLTSFRPSYHVTDIPVSEAVERLMRL